MCKVIGRSSVTGESYGEFFRGEYEECEAFVDEYEPEGNEYLSIES